MGCNKSALISYPEVLSFKMQLAIRNNQPKHLRRLLVSAFPETDTKESINSYVFVVESLEVNLLGYALLMGKFKAFLYIHTSLTAKIEIMESIFNRQHRSALEIICNKGYLDLLQYYLPIYVEGYMKSEESPINYSFNTSLLAANKEIIPIQVACEKGHISLLDFINGFFTPGKHIPMILDVNYQSQNLGENCAFIACRQCNFPLVMFLNEKCRARFEIRNYYGESVLVVTACASRQNVYLNYLDIFMYLIEVVKIDFEDDFEEILLLLEDDEILEYFQKCLNSMNIHENKESIEKRFALDSVKASSGSVSILNIKSALNRTRLIQSTTSSITIKTDKLSSVLTSPSIIEKIS